MATLKERLNYLVALGKYMLSTDEKWQETILLAKTQNGWFDEQHVNIAVKNIAENFLQENLLNDWLSQYPKIEQRQNELNAINIGLVMAGNIPLVGFHDFICCYISGVHLKIKFSSKDTLLWKAIFEKMQTLDISFNQQVEAAEMLKNCDAYIATGSNNSARYFDYYFQKYPNIIRRNRTSAAIITGHESIEELQNLTDDVSLFYGLGCRNVTQIFVPNNYDFKPLLATFKKQEHLLDNHKYKNNYDYQLALLLLNKQPCLTNEVILLTESEQPFAAISTLHYRYFTDKNELIQQLKTDERYQCIVGNHEGLIPFGMSQQPTLDDYADGVDTMNFLSNLNKI